MTRTAISPRFATRILSTARSRDRPLHRSEWDVAVLLRRVLVALGLERGEAVDQLRARLMGTDDLVDEAALRGDVRVCELLAVLGNPGRARRGDIRGGIELALVKNIDRSLGAHDRDLGRRPREVRIGPDVLARHDAIRAAIRLA